MRLRHFIALTFAFTVPTLAAHADTYRYTFTDTLTTVGAMVTFDESHILTTDTIILPADFLTATGLALSSLELNPTSRFCGGSPAGGGVSCFQLTAASGLTLRGFGTTTFDAVGTFNLGGDVLMIADITPPSTVPEPSTIALLGTGLLGTIGAARRRFKA